MEFNNCIKKIIIVSNNYIYNIGIKTILSVTDIKPKLFDVETIDELKSLLQEQSCPLYIILNEDFFKTNLDKELLKIKIIAPDCPIMLLKNHETIINTDISYINYDEGQAKILNKLDLFFNDNNQEDSKQEQSILSEREKGVLKEVAIGLSNKEIADKLFISVNTVITHRKNITEKLGIKTIAGLTIYAILNKYINPQESVISKNE